MPPSSALALINDLLLKRPENIKREKELGRKVAGYFCSYIPEEIIWAMGMIPVRLCRFGDNRATSAGATYLTNNACPFACSCVGLKEGRRDEYFELVDVVVDAPACLQMRRVLEVWGKYFGAKVFQLDFPRRFYAPEAQAYFAQALEQFKMRLIDYLGVRPDAAHLVRAVKLFNNIRRQQRRLYDDLKNDSFPLSWRQVLGAVRAGFLLDKEEYLGLLHRLQDQLVLSPPAKSSANGIRLLLAGAMLAPGDEKLLNILHELGTDAVMDELCTGSRSIYGEIESPDSSAIARRYLSNIPCGSLPYPRLNNDPRHNHLRRLVTEYKINGVIYYTLRFCDAYNFKVGHIRHLINSLGIGFLHISSDYSNADVGQLRTRVEAFIESIRYKSNHAGYGR
jgi:benzoyl-CoA reductase/2-hydroxyglutaryl-CoA dehydratase subunit BcrC/BadD/HgdB